MYLNIKNHIVECEKAIRFLNLSGLYNNDNKNAFNEFLLKELIIHLCVLSDANKICSSHGPQQL